MHCLGHDFHLMGTFCALFYFILAVKLIVGNVPIEFADRLTQTISRLLTTSHHVEFYLEWAVEMLNQFGTQEGAMPHTVLLGLHQSLQKKYEALSKV